MRGCVWLCVAVCPWWWWDEACHCSSLAHAVCGCVAVSLDEYRTSTRRHEAGVSHSGSIVPVPNVDATTADTPTAPSVPPRSTAPLTAPDTTPGELETKLDDADGLVIEGSAEADDTHGGTVNPGTPSAAGAPAAAASIRKPRRHTPSGYVVHASARVPDPREHPRLPWHDVHMCVTGPAAVDMAMHFIQRWNHHRLTKVR